MIRGSGSSMSFYRYLCERTTKVSNMESAFREKLTEEKTRGERSHVDEPAPSGSQVWLEEEACPAEATAFYFPHSTREKLRLTTLRARVCPPACAPCLPPRKSDGPFPGGKAAPRHRVTTTRVDRFHDRGKIVCHSS